MISVIVPAYKEEKYIGGTINSIKRAQDFLLNQRGIPSEIVVVDNHSSDRTADIARSCAVKLLSEPTHNVAKGRNIGASQASGDILVFIDADVMVPQNLLCRIDDAISSELCLGGSVDVNYQPIKYSVKVYLRLWRFVGKLAGNSYGPTPWLYFSLGGER